MAAGDFSATSLGRQKLKVADIFKNAGESYDDIQIGKAVLENQTATMSAIQVGTECRGAQVSFLKDCEDTIEACGDVDLSSCDWGGDQIESATADLDVNDCVVDQFNVNNTECQDNEYTYDMIYAQRLALGLQKIEEKLAIKAGVFIDANSRIPENDPAYGVKDGDAVEFAAADFDDLGTISKMSYVARQNQIDNPYALSTGLMWVAQDLNRRKGGGFGIYTDPTSGVRFYYDQKFSQLETAVGTPAIYYVDPDNVAFWTYGYEQSDTWVDKLHNDQFSRRIALPRLKYSNGGSLQTIYVDLHRKRVCNQTLSGWTDKFIMRLKFGFLTAPDICEDGNTGILKFRIAASS